MNVMHKSEGMGVGCVEGASVDLSQLVQFLQQSESSLSLAMITLLLKNIKLNDSEISTLALFDQQRYHRRYLYNDKNVQVLMLGWLNGQRSKIHDHVGSNCGVKVLRGTATETYFASADNKQIYATGSSQLKEGEITAGCNEDKHQISNLQADNKALITLHIYSPPLNDFNLYSLDSEKIEKPEQKDKWMYEI
ncbi:cysteine dioxygenase [Aliivibrio kagoshimensis]|uniref:cysteine dioxygenase n=1 Tax=Aliivibrio kagoshimensis TaxID=2910230 RepID=UPI003D114ECA